MQGKDLNPSTVSLASRTDIFIVEHLPTHGYSMWLFYLSLLLLFILLTLGFFHHSLAIVHVQFLKTFGLSFIIVFWMLLCPWPYFWNKKIITRYICKPTSLIHWGCMSLSLPQIHVQIVSQCCSGSLAVTQVESCRTIWGRPTETTFVLCFVFRVRIMPRTYFWLYTKELVLVVLGNHVECQGLNPGRLCTRQTSYPLSYCSASEGTLQKLILYLGWRWGLGFLGKPLRIKPGLGSEWEAVVFHESTRSGYD